MNVCECKIQASKEERNSILKDIILDGAFHLDSVKSNDATTNEFVCKISKMSFDLEDIKVKVDSMLKKKHKNIVISFE